MGALPPDEDFSEARDQAEALPERLRELQDLWWEEADRYGVLPLDDRILERFLVDKPRPLTTRTRFVYHPGTYMPSEAAASPIDRSHTVSAIIDPYCKGQEGVLLAHGDRFAGYTFYVAQGRLRYDYNCAGDLFSVRSDVQIPDGVTKLGFSFRRTARLAGEIMLRHGGAVATKGVLTKTLGVHINAIGISTGRDTYGPVSPAYRAPFPYSGGLRRVEIDLVEDAGPRDSDWLAD